jgi:hypothetical protein
VKERGLGIALVGLATALLSRCNAVVERYALQATQPHRSDAAHALLSCRAKLERTPMRMPMQARQSFIRYAILPAALLLGACGRDLTSPAPVSTQKAVPETASRELFGAPDGVYVVTFKPQQDQDFWLGKNHLSIPAHSVCDLDSSGYGADYWDKACTPERQPVTMTVVIKNSETDHPQVDFFPAMRFSPDKNVQLFIYAPNVSETDAKNWWMFYCNDFGTCMDESLTDLSLRTYIDYNAKMVSRRVKHFSGYVVAERTGEESGESTSIQ